MSSNETSIKAPPAAKQADTTATSKGNLSPRTSRVLNDIVNVASLIPVVADARTAITAARAGADAVEAVGRHEAGRMAQAATEKPYARSVKGTQGENANLTTSRGPVKQSPPTGTRINLQKVVNPASAKNMAAKQAASDARVAAVKSSAAANNSAAMANLKRTALGTAAAGAVNTVRLNSAQSQSLPSARQAGTGLNSASRSGTSGAPTRGVNKQ
jgi:hypothetical protein